MIGERTVAQEPLFYSFGLERHVPADNMLRSIDRFEDLRASANIDAHIHGIKTHPPEIAHAGRKRILDPEDLLEIRARLSEPVRRRQMSR